MSFILFCTIQLISFVPFRSLPFFSAPMSNDCMQVCVSAHVEVTESPTASSQPRRPRADRKGILVAPRLAKMMTHGNKVFTYAKLMVGEAAISHTIQSGAKFRLPRGFWKACCKHSFNRVCTDAFRKYLSKVLGCYIRSLRQGATTKCGMLRGACPEQRRSKGGSMNSSKCPELGQLLYDWFIDCIHVDHARATNHLIMREARRLHARLLSTGYQPQALPKLTGQAGHSWFYRWRQVSCYELSEGCLLYTSDAADE